MSRISHHRAVFTVALHHGLDLENNPDAYKTKGLIIQFTDKPHCMDYPPPQRYNVAQGHVCNIDFIRRTTDGDLSDFDQAIAEGRRMGIMVFCYRENLVRQWQRVTMPPPIFLKRAARTVEGPRDSWVMWLDKAVNENFEAKIKFSKPPARNDGRR
ncbi:hypothetical protein CONPUDRAFT_150511 [Coniophora puteana RWD-64-598 SS2]|uniref:Uncharacterized protein n=1 Tax=Coniophora puteana (strain RWD-64-598) TaxID=741705 RepID=A0A5M3N2W3_CONPW|nr:uncharacterized protein CONPUDRAFT_150511 [Coniophora puteana RWD-64-598 SS2]EIW85720.1 hypothetical protein CONPUDRAFT_150511 [Coniophora puteana RWD-64-598 SS2]